MILTAADLKPYQREGLAFLLSARRERGVRRCRVLGDDPGLGKTATASLAAGELLRTDPRGGVVVAQKTLVTVWKNEMIKWGVNPDVITIAKGSADLRMPEPGEVLILSYDSLASLHRKIPTPRKPKKDESAADFEARKAAARAREARRVERFLRFYRRGFGFIIADEIQKVRRARSGRSLAFEKLRQHAAKEGAITIVLSGTLIENTPLDLWVLACCLGVENLIFDGGIVGFATHFGGVYDDYSKRWAFPVIPPGGSIFPALAESQLFLVRAIEDVEGQLPPKTYRATVCPCPDNLVSLSSVLASALGNLEELAAGGQLEDIEEAARGAGILGELSRCRKETATAKIPTMLRRLDELGTSQGPIVVYSEHVEPIETLRTRPGWAVITGGETSAQREKIAAAFQAGEYEGIGITSAMREGWTLTRSRYMLKVSPSWLYQWERQSDARIWRLGQTEPVTIEVLVAEHWIDRAVYKRIAEGRARDRETWRRPAV